MKARSKELLDRAIAATIAAIEIYNKPDFRYREEAFAVLAINGWELLLNPGLYPGCHVSGFQPSAAFTLFQRDKLDYGSTARPVGVICQ